MTARQTQQFRLELQRPPSHRREDLVVSAANAEALRALDAWPAWHGGALALVGPEGSGKTHLADIWRSRSGSVVLGEDVRDDGLDGLAGRPVLVEDADRVDQEALFHLINMAGQPGGGLLLTSRLRPSQWPCSLPDLRSRLNALPVFEIGPPDDEILEGVLRKFFRERNIRPAEDVFPYLVRRMERSVPVACALVERLDQASDAEQRPVSRALARQILEQDEETGDLFTRALADEAEPGEKQA